MSVYNGSQYLNASLDSLLGQTFSDFELIAINDGSKDDSLSILETYARQDNRIRIVENETNIGLTKSLNKGIRLARGEYIARQDVDDISLARRLELQTQFLDTHPEVGTLGSAIQLIDDSGQPISLDNSGQTTPATLTNHSSLQAHLLFNNCLIHSSMMFRTDLAQEVGGYNESFRYSQDYDLWWRLGRIKHLANLPDVLVQMRRSSDSITQQKREQQLDCAYTISLNILQELVGTENLNEESYRKFWWTTLLSLDFHTYQNIWVKNNSPSGLLTSKDVENLTPVWEFLSTFDGASEISGPFLSRLSRNLMYEQLTEAGLHLLLVTRRYLKTDIQWNRTSRALIKPYAKSLFSLVGLTLP